MSSSRRTAKDQTAIKLSQSGYTWGVGDVLSANGSPSHGPRGGSGRECDVVLVVAAGGTAPRDGVGMSLGQGVYIVVQAVVVGLW